MKTEEAAGISLGRQIIKGILLAFILLRPFIDGLTYPIQNSIFQLVVVFLVLLWLFNLFCRKGETFPLLRSPSDLPIFLFLLLLLVGSSFSSSHYLSLHLSLQFISYFLLYWLVVNNIEEKEVKGFLVILLFSATLVSLYGIYQYFWGLEATREFIAVHYRMDELPQALLARLSSNRVFSTYVYPNILAGYLIMLFPIGLVMAMERKTFFSRFGFLAICALLLLCLFYTRSVGGWISLVFILGFFLIFYFFKERKKILFFGGLFLSLSLLIFFLFFKFEGLPHPSAFQDRLGYWTASLRMIKEGPFFGSGPGTFGSRFARYKLAYTMETQHAHNNFLEVWVESGIFGLLLFLWIWWNFFRAA
ncbi:MAG: O-antigen ligase family protein, partial [Candidatus Omnitrophica bacterium]|nr:O-antigen ligase family protein [Candidatus Omnitrophota bacterium]